MNLPVLNLEHLVERHRRMLAEHPQRHLHARWRHLAQNFHRLCRPLRAAARAARFLRKSRDNLLDSAEAKASANVRVSVCVEIRARVRERVRVRVRVRVTVRIRVIYPFELIQILQL